MNIKSHFEKHTVKLTKELEKFMLQKLPGEVRCIEVIVFRESLPYVPFRIFFLDRFKSSSKTAENFKPLADLKKLIDSPEYITREDATFDCLNLENESEQDACAENVEEEYNDENSACAQWFAECWLNAGGESYPLHAFIVEEYGQFKPINLKTGRSIKHMQEYSQIFDG